MTYRTGQRPVRNGQDRTVHCARDCVIVQASCLLFKSYLLTSCQSLRMYVQVGEPFKTAPVPSVTADYVSLLCSSSLLVGLIGILGA